MLESTLNNGQSLGQVRRIRILLAKLGLDGHDRGIKVVARALRDAGFEVIYAGLRQTPEMVVRAALEEDVSFIGISLLSDAHMTLAPKVLELLRAEGLDKEIDLLVGGIIPQDDAEELMSMGVGQVFAPGTQLDQISEYILRRWDEKQRQLQG